MADSTIHVMFELALQAAAWLAVGATLGVAVTTRGWRRREPGGVMPVTPGTCREILQRRLEAALMGKRDGDSAPALIVLNIDNFRLVNDGFGHAAGDALLAEAERRIRDALRHVDTPARVGGDEFLILLENPGGSAPALAVAERLRLSVSQPYDLAGQRFQLSASIGLALAPRHGRTAEDLIRSATAAMSAIKRRGGDGVELPTTSQTTGASDRLKLEASLRRALDRGEFELHYQPKFSLAAGLPRLIGAEALLRWNHPDRGMMPPGSFIEFAEDTGLIVPIGDWVLREALNAAKRWNAAGGSLAIEPSVAVNLSFRQFDRPNFFEFVRDLLLEVGVDPRQLELELTERIVMRNPDSTVEVLQRLRALGVRLSIDDFGTGYSSLSLLKRLPVQSVKIDRSFMRDVPNVEEDTAIATAILGLAHTLGLEVVAEGVETDAQLTFLRSQGCDAVQGFLLGRPMREIDFQSVIRQTATRNEPRPPALGFSVAMPGLAAALPATD